MYILKNDKNDILACAQGLKEINDAKIIYGIKEGIIEETKEDILTYNGKLFTQTRWEEYIKTEQYRQIEIKKQNQERIDEIKLELEKIDAQRVRAIAEPGIKDKLTGETWLEYYNDEMKKLRDELKNLEQ